MRKNYVKYIAALLLFGTNGVVASHIDLSSVQTVFTRTLLGAILMGSVARAAAVRRTGREDAAKADRAPFARDILFVVASGTCMGLSWMFQYEAFRHIGVGITSLIYCLGPVALIASSPFLFGERFEARRMVGFAVALAGILLVNSRFSGGSPDPWGIFCAIMCAAMYAGMVILNKRAVSIRGIDNAAVQLAAGFAVTAAVCSITGELPFSIPEASWPAVLLLGLFNTGFCCYLYFSAINALPAQTVAICDYIEPLSAVVFAGLFLGESLAPLQITGASLIVAGALGSELARARPALRRTNGAAEK